MLLDEGVSDRISDIFAAARRRLEPLAALLARSGGLRPPTVG
jgi:hypothetical protein